VPKRPFPSNYASLLTIIGIGAGTAFALIARAVARRKTAAVDHDVHGRVAIDPEHPVRRAAEAAAPIGKWWAYVPAAALTGGYVVASRRRASSLIGSASILGAAGIAYGLSKAFDDVLPQPPAPPGRDTRDHPVFPSGHAFGTTSVALAAAYVLWREELAPAPFAFPAALAIPVASSVGRLVEEKHWISDIAGGFLAAIAVASLTSAAYEACSER
jgi:membrane-associated phospholipid phosphatase